MYARDPNPHGYICYGVSILKLFRKPGASTFRCQAFYPSGIGADPIVSQYLFGYAPRGEPCKEFEPRLAATPHSFYDLSILAVSPLFT